jgi:hypothetical protein
MEYSNSEIAIPMAKGIPSVSLGLSTGEGGNTPRSYIDINPITQGVFQIITLLSIIDTWREKDD